MDNIELRKEFNKMKTSFKKTHTPQCRRCGFFPPWETKQWMEIHHIIPLIDGGDNSESNLIVLCHQCHREWHFHYEGNIEFNEFLNTVPFHVIGSALQMNDVFGYITLNDFKKGWPIIKAGIEVREPWKNEYCKKYTETHCNQWKDW